MPATATWTIPLLPALGWAAAAAVLLSLQFLAQVWIWLYWSVSDILLTWVGVLGDRVLVALTIALSAWWVGRLKLSSLRWRAALLALALVLGALIGEAGLRLADDGPRAPLGNVALRWVLIALCVAGMYGLWRRSALLHARWQNETLERLRGQEAYAQAQLVALKNQIEPHFLFNTLATVRRLHRTEPAAGALMLAHFIDYLRRTLPMLDTPQVPLAQELALIKAYLAVVAVRMGGRLRIEFDVPEDLNAQPLPPLVLATLVENAVKHGLTPAPDGGLLRIAARVEGPWIRVLVEDSGVGLGAASTGGSGIGLANARARLRALHGSAASLQLEGVQPHGVRATVKLPVAGA